MRQFDVIVWNTKKNSTTSSFKPPFTDSALEWFYGNKINDSLDKTDAEWIVISNENVIIDREFLNDLAQAIEGFPMVDAFSPRVSNKKTGLFYNGFILDKWNAIITLENEAKLRYVATSTPYIVAFSRRIIQRTGHFDLSLPIPIALIDYSFRMLHAGGKMFSIPYLVSALRLEDDSIHFNQKQFESPLLLTLFKNFGIGFIIPYILKHPKTIKILCKKRKEINKKRESAILLSKLKNDYLKEILH